MTRLFVIILLISMIIAISNIAMQMVKKEDEKNGLYLDDKYYSIKNTLFSSHKQDKRIKKYKKVKPEYYIESFLWNRTFLTTIISIMAATVFAYLFNQDKAL